VHLLFKISRLKAVACTLHCAGRNRSPLASGPAPCSDRILDSPAGSALHPVLQAGLLFLLCCVLLRGRSSTISWRRRSDPAVGVPAWLARSGADNRCHADAAVFAAALRDREISLSGRKHKRARTIKQRRPLTKPSKWTYNAILQRMPRLEGKLPSRRPAGSGRCGLTAKISPRFRSG